MDREDAILKRIKKELDSAAADYDGSRREIDGLIETFITDIKQNLRFYVFENIKRVAVKNPEQVEKLEGGKLDLLREELDAPLGEETDRIVAELRDYPGWYDDATIYIDTGSKPWKAVKSVEAAVNRVLKKFDISPIDMKNWTWLSAETNELISGMFQTAKKDYIMKRKHYRYTGNRYEEERRIRGVLDRLEEL